MADHYEWVADAPFLTFKVTKAGYDLPTSVMKEIWRYTALMNEGYDLEGNPNTNCNQIAAAYENSEIIIGFTEEEKAEIASYELHQMEGTPVAVWNSGVSSGCRMYLYLMPEGSENEFEWTEP